MKLTSVLFICCVGMMACKKEQEALYTNLRANTTTASEIDHVNMPTILHFEGSHTLVTHETGWYFDNPFASNPNQIFVDTTYVETVTFGHNHTPYLIVNGGIEYRFNGTNSYNKIDYSGGYYNTSAQYILNTNTDSIFFESSYNCPTSGRHYSSYGKKQ